MIFSEVYSREWHDLAETIVGLVHDCYDESDAFSTSMQPTRLVIYDSEEYDEDNDPIGDLDETWSICVEAINGVLGTQLPPQPLLNASGEVQAKMGTVWFEIRSRLGKLSYEIQYRN